MVTVVIPSYGRFQSLHACVTSVLESSPLPDGGIEVVVVTARYSHAELAEIEKLGCRVQLLPEPVPTSDSRNVGAAAALGDHLLFLDDDNVVAPDAISKLHLGLKSWLDAVLVGPVMYYGSAPNRIWCAGVHRTRVLMRTKMRVRLEEPATPRLVSEDFPNCFMVKKDDFDEVGGFDADLFPQQWEEADLARRMAKKTGRRVYCVPNARVWHFIALALAERLHLRDGKRAYLCARGRALFTARYGDRLQWLAYLLVAQWLFATVYLGSALRLPGTIRSRVMVGYLRGLYAGFRIGLSVRKQYSRRQPDKTSIESSAGRVSP